MISSVSSLSRKATHQRIRHGVMDEVDAQEPGRIGDSRMPAVEDAKLHQLEGRHLGREGDPDLLQRRAARGEIVFEHPLPERLAEDRPVVLMPKRSARCCARGRWSPA